MNKKWEEEFDDIEKYIIKHVKEKPSLALELIKASEKIDKEIYKVRLAKQRTQLLARVREEVIKTKRKKAIWLDAIWYNEAIDDVLKKLEIISEEVK